MRKMRNVSCRMLVVIGVYIVISLFLLSGDDFGEREKALYTMEVTWLTVSEDLGDTPVYRQGFYTVGS